MIHAGIPLNLPEGHEENYALTFRLLLYIAVKACSLEVPAERSPVGYLGRSRMRLA